MNPILFTQSTCLSTAARWQFAISLAVGPMYFPEARNPEELLASGACGR
jgi:hypothetical protein